jgi:hypothetical protein
MKDFIDHYAAGKKWYWYIPLWLLGLYVFVSILGFNPNQPTSFVTGFMYTVIFGVHEIAHLATAFFPPIVTAAAGSLSELLITSTFVVVAVLRRYYFAASLFLLWVMLAYQSAGTYMSDARSKDLQLVGFGEKVEHDWSFVFEQLGILSADTFIGTSLKVIGVGLGVIGLFRLMAAV